MRMYTTLKFLEISWLYWLFLGRILDLASWAADLAAISALYCTALVQVLEGQQQKHVVKTEKS